MKLILFLILLALVASATGLFIWKKGQKPEISIQKKKQILEILISASEKLQDLWINGNDFVEKLSDVDEEFYRCNPHALDQFFQKSALKIKYRKQSYLIKAKSRGNSGKHHLIITRSNTDGVKIPSYAAMFELYVEKYPTLTLKVLLEDMCHDSYLPQRIYGFGLYDYENDWRWDNFNRHIYVDKHLVTNRDISDWKPMEGKDPSSPATDLTLEQMIEYCAFRGKSLLTAEVFDAATFHPGDMENTKPIRNPRGPYPWSRVSKTFLFNARHDPYFEFDQGDCGRVYSKDCRQNSVIFERYDTRSNSWMGIFQVLGGYPEQLHNILNPKENLKLSSFYYPWKSDWHSLGVRGNWNENREKEVGFRCMRLR